MYRVLTTYRPVGRWGFEDRAGGSQSWWPRLLRTAARVAVILDAARLLTITRAVVTQGADAQQVELPGGSLDPLLTRLDGWLAVGPISSVELRGHGEVTLGERCMSLPDPVVLVLVNSGFPRVEIQTFVDVWMPHDLAGKPQVSTHRANAPRLRGALEAIAGLGLDPQFDDATDYAAQDGYELANLTDGDGEPADVLATRQLLPDRVARLG